jgi:isoquinoline 1-oxidoreductase beta subunit
MNFTIENAFQTTRRGFLKGGAGLALAIVTPVMANAPAAGPGLAGSAMVDGEFSPGAFLRIGTDGTVTVVSKHLEMGQGVYTGLATLVADELDADWDKVKVEARPGDAKRYNNLFWGPAQGTGGSTAIANSFEQMRRAGADRARHAGGAAAAQWKVPASQITVKAGVVSHAASQKAGFGELAEAAGKQPVPAEVTLKDAKDFTLIGRAAPRVDSVSKTNGTRDLHAGRQAARHADRRRRPPAALRRQGAHRSTTRPRAPVPA